MVIPSWIIGMAILKAIIFHFLPFSIEANAPVPPCEL
jgi:hypothetical protein